MDSGYIYQVSRKISSFLLKVFFGIEAEGQNLIPKKSSFILASNHFSHLDPIALGVIAPRALHYLAKEELFKNPIFGWYLKRLNVIPLKRGKSDTFAIRSAVRILRKNQGLLIFPQGSRSENFDKSFSGVGFLFRKTGAPIILANIKGTKDILPKGRLIPRPHKIKVVFKKAEKLNRDDNDAVIARKVLEEIKSMQAF